jgi:hypothetical protein
MFRPQGGRDRVQRIHHGIEKGAPQIRNAPTGSCLRVCRQESFTPNHRGRKWIDRENELSRGRERRGID